MKRFPLVLFVSWAQLAVAQSSHVTVRTLSLAECVRTDVEHNLGVRIEEKGIEIVRHRLSQSYGIYDPSLRGGVSRGNSPSPGGIDDQNRAFSGTKTERNNIQVAFAGLPPTGLEYDIGGEFTDSSCASPDGPFENTGGSVGPNLRQPLLRNLWIDDRRLNIRVSKHRLKISELVWRGQLMETVTRVEPASYDHLLAQDSVTMQEQALRFTQELLEANRERIQQLVMSALDEKQAESQVSAPRSLLLVAQRTLSLQENAIKGLLSDNLSEGADVSIQPPGDLVAVLQKVHRSESWQRGLANRPDLLQAREDLERFGYIMRYNPNQMFPQLDGRSTRFLVLLLQRDFTSARSEEIRPLAEYNRALAQLDLCEGSVLERHQFALEVR